MSECLVPRPRIPTLLHGALPGRCLTLALLPLLSEIVSHTNLLHRDYALDDHLIALSIVGGPHAALH